MSIIAYQNKDIISKTFIAKFGSTSLDVYGLDLPEVMGLEDTNLPEVWANEIRPDAILCFSKKHKGIVDFESKYIPEYIIAYENYHARYLQRLLDDGTKFNDLPQVDIIVIYTADVKRENVPATYKNGGVQINIIPAFLSEFPANQVFPELQEAVKNGELTQRQLMQMIILPLAYRTKRLKQKMIRETVELAANIQNQEQMVFALSGLLVFTDKVVDDATREYVMRRINMTAYGQYLEDKAIASTRSALDLAFQLMNAKHKVEECRQMAKRFHTSVNNACIRAHCTQEYNDSVALLKKYNAFNMTEEEIKDLAISQFPMLT